MAVPAPLPWPVESRLPGVAWPAVPAPAAAQLFTLLFQLERTQWLAPEDLRALQLRQLEQLIRHAAGTVPYYRERLSGKWSAVQPLTWEAFGSFPLLGRTDLQTNGASMASETPVAQHGPVTDARTSGSTGMPVRVLRTAVDGLFWNAFTLRDHAWHCRDLAGKLCAIRQGVTEAHGDNWGAATRGVIRTGTASTFPVSRDVAAQMKWLEEQQPDYLLSHPTNVGALARRSIEQGMRLPRLREVRTSGEALDPEVRGLCREAWGVPVIDMYSANEVGYIALQCPGTEHYHVMAEGLLVEVLDDAGRACRPGETGRVVVTTLHNFAMPLVRYVIGDYAEVGVPCPCGRGLPVLTRVLGRVRNMLVLANGGRFWPAFGLRGLVEELRILQHQIVQKTTDLIEARLAVAAPLDAGQEERLRNQLLSRLPSGFQVRFVYCDGIPRNVGGKYEDFLSEVTASPGP
jgi:phenylacetate-CoA ligase